MKTGTRIEVSGCDLQFNRTWEPAQIVRTTARMKPLPEGYRPVRFDRSSGILLVHKSRFRVTDNRAA